MYIKPFVAWDYVSSFVMGGSSQVAQICNSSTVHVTPIGLGCAALSQIMEIIKTVTYFKLLY